LTLTLDVDRLVLRLVALAVVGTLWLLLFAIYVEELL